MLETEIELDLLELQIRENPDLRHEAFAAIAKVQIEEPA